MTAPSDAVTPSAADEAFAEEAAGMMCPDSIVSGKRCVLAIIARVRQEQHEATKQACAWFVGDAAIKARILALTLEDAPCPKP